MLSISESEGPSCKLTRGPAKNFGWGHDPDLPFQRDSFGKSTDHPIVRIIKQRIDRDLTRVKKLLQLRQNPSKFGCNFAWKNTISVIPFQVKSQQESAPTLRSDWFDCHFGELEGRSLVCRRFDGFATGW